MKTFGVKLIALINVHKIVFYNAEGFKIEPKAKYLDLGIHKHFGNEKRDGFFAKSSAQSSFFDPHTDPKDIELQEVAVIVSQELECRLENYPEFIVAASSKLIGYIKKHLSPQALKITRFVIKDIADEYDINQISKIVFE